MQLTIERIDDVCVVRFEGNLDTNTAPEAEEKIAALISDGAGRMLADFRALDYISSAGLRILLWTAKQLGASNGELRVCSLNETVREVFDMSGFSSILGVYDNEDEAMKGF
ncbi:MAG: STAS domain-containing protein [Planctomycetota bacterium]|jgi:anti-anti-sigma factor